MAAKIKTNEYGDCIITEDDALEFLYTNPDFDISKLYFEDTDQYKKALDDIGVDLPKIKNVPKRDIDKFIRDVQESDVHCGIMCSENTGIANREDLQIEIVEGKPLIYLHQTKTNLIESIKLTADFIRENGPKSFKYNQGKQFFFFKSKEL